MSAVYIISKNGERLMPTVRYGHARHLLKDGKAIVFQGIRSPFSLPKSGGKVPGFSSGEYIKDVVKAGVEAPVENLISENE